MPFDPVIRFYKGCQKWLDQVKHNISSLQEQNLFEISTMFKKELLEPLSEIFQEELLSQVSMQTVKTNVLSVFIIQGKNAFQSTGFLCYLRSLLLSFNCYFLFPSLFSLFALLSL